MSTGDLPQISSALYSSSGGFGASTVFGKPTEESQEIPRRLIVHAAEKIPFNPPQHKETVMASNTRLVKVFIVDPNESLPLPMRLLYKGDEKLTDLTDQELFFEVDIKSILDKHNAVRAETVDKTTKNKDKPEMLEPARVRDLRMQVIVLAQF
jgi:hypothetical protein